MTSKGLFGVQNSALHAAYSEQLFSLGLGLPLLHPYPVDLGDLLLGEVGYMDNGTFHRLYKAMSPNDNARQRTPRSYMPLSLSGSLGSKFTRDTIPIGPGAVCSEGITCLSKYDDVQRIGGRGVAFQAGRPSGSIMVLPEAATRYRLDCDSDRSIASYMLRHYQDWHEELSTSAPQNDTSSAKTLMLISGCVRSAHWANATFYGVDSTATVTFRRASEREHSSFTLASSSGELHHHSSLSSGTVGTVSHSGEWANPAWTQSEITLTPSRLKHALFLSYYKLRLRSPSSNYAQSRQVETDEHEDYVDYLLAYILRHSSAEAAAAHDGDVYALFEGNKIPRKHEFARFLEDLAPRIDVDQAGLGMLITGDREPTLRIFPTIRSIYTGRRRAGLKTSKRRNGELVIPATNTLEVVIVLSASFATEDNQPMLEFKFGRGTALSRAGGGRRASPTTSILKIVPSTSLDTEDHVSVLEFKIGRNMVLSPAGGGRGASRKSKRPKHVISPERFSQHNPYCN